MTRNAANPLVLKKEIRELYTKNNFRPLNGVLPSLLQLPIIISTYRTLLNLVKYNKLQAPFLYLPSLSGPQYATGRGAAWLFRNWDISSFPPTPSLGWPATLAFLSVPVILASSQYISIKQLSPAQSADVPKYIPLLMFYISLNVPCAIGIWWIADTLINVIATKYMRKRISRSVF
jgi:membrane protein insertase Oxa1/YidC/SpoIIIJ